MLNTLILLTVLVGIVIFSVTYKHKLLEGFDSGNANPTGPASSDLRVQGPANWNPSTNSQLSNFYPNCNYLTASDANMAFRELSILVDKIDAISSDISTSGHKSVSIPYNTNQDLEPAAYLVGRCQRKIIRERDINLQIDQYQRRGEQLIQELNVYYPGKASFATQFVVQKTSDLKSLMMAKCLKEQPQLDIPGSPRDPAYYESEELEELRATSTFLPWVNS
jgi:hypothetical protein